MGGSKPIISINGDTIGEIALDLSHEGSIKYKSYQLDGIFHEPTKPLYQSKSVLMGYTLSEIPAEKKKPEFNMEDVPSEPRTYCSIQATGQHTELFTMRDDGVIFCSNHAHLGTTFEDGHTFTPWMVPDTSGPVKLNVLKTDVSDLEPCVVCGRSRTRGPNTSGVMVCPVHCSRCGHDRIHEDYLDFCSECQRSTPYGPCANDAKKAQDGDYSGWIHLSTQKVEEIIAKTLDENLNGNPEIGPNGRKLSNKVMYELLSESIDQQMKHYGA